MILTKKEILKEIQKKNVKIFPFKKENIGPASIDLTLSNTFHIFPKKREIVLGEKMNLEKITVLKKQKTIRVNPGDFILAMTKEKITLPQNLCAFLSGRSSFARMGLSIEASFFIPPGVSNHQVLEIKNLSSHPVILDLLVKPSLIE